MGDVKGWMRAHFLPNIRANVDAVDSDDRPVVWLDIDNTLYSASSKISQAMGERIHGASYVVSPSILYSRFKYIAYFVALGWADDEASELHHKYYTQYGLALRGLVRHHQVGGFILSSCSMLSSYIVLVHFRPPGL